MVRMYRCYKCNKHVRVFLPEELDVEGELAVNEKGLSDVI